MTSFHDPDLCRSILESLPSGLCVLDMEKKIVFWSEGAERITGYLRHEVVGHSCMAETVLHCDQSGGGLCKDDCPVARTIKTAHLVDAVGLLHHKAGHEFPVRIRAVPVHNQHGSIIGAVETFEEVQSATASDLHEYSRKVPGCIDPVTSVASPDLMRFHLRQALATFVEVEVPFCVLSVRLDGLQHFRASLGPEAGSSLLRVVARSLESSFWKTDHVGRWTDDQFLVILNGCRQESLHSVGDRVTRMLARDGIEWWGEHRSLPVLVGEAAVQSGDAIESLIERAQKSLETAAATRAHAASAPSGTSGS
jgi:diguanylate cyclase (GGDEF)-like protein/PAS domain S-box-containing protein